MATSENNTRRAKIRTRLSALDMTQAEAAQRAGMSAGQFSQIMNGIIEPSADMSDRIAAALGRTRRALAL